MNQADLRELTRLLQRPGAVAPADGIAVSVRSLRISRGRDGGELLIRYSASPLPDGVARQPLPGDADLATYAAEVAEELQAWAIEHVRKYRPLPPFDRDQVRSELPSRDGLWRMLVSEFSDVGEIPGGFAGRNRHGAEVRVMLSPERWQEYVVGREIGCRKDYGVDALSAGDGPAEALFDLDEAMATMDPDESFLVLDGHRLTGSVRAGPPAAHGSAGEREAGETRRRGGGRWYATFRDGRPADPFDD